MGKQFYQTKSQGKQQVIKRILIVWSMVLSVNSCVQIKKENYAPMDFMEYNGDLSFS